MLDNKVQKEWAKNGVVRLVDLSQDYYLVQFASEEDYKHALFEGPWLIADHYIVVQRWRPFFTVTATQTRKIAAWIRIPGLPIELFNDRFLWRVGSKLGTMLKIDKLTSIQSRGRFARICVEIDLQKKLVSQINVLGHILKLEYEGLHSICFKQQENSHDQAQENATEQSGGQPIPDSDEQYGPWMIVRRNKKPHKSRAKISTSNSNYNSKINAEAPRVATQMVKDVTINSTYPSNIGSHKPSMMVRNVTGGKNPQSARNKDPHVPINVGKRNYAKVGVYGSPHSQFRVDLWRDIKRLATEVNGAWCLLGDFNVVLQDDERYGGTRKVCYRGDQSFREVVQELLWFQKSRCKWLEFGDRNTRYFHGTTLVRRRKNKVVKIQNELGEWIEDKAKLEALTTRFYSNLFTDSGRYEPYCLTNSFPELPQHDKDKLAIPLTQQEIFTALKRMGGLKAPGPYGFNALFYQTQWQTVGPSICELLTSIFDDPTKVAEINKTFIALIPKVDNITSLRQMRPISLCNVSYKILTKVIATRLRGIMEDFVGPNQCSFVPFRQSTDNIIITQEVIHSMKYKSGRKGWMAIKIDLEKAYDRLSWEFIRETLTDIGIPKNLIGLIWHCISSPSMQVLWNGEALSEFTPSRGIRQGDPLSPYIFVLCMERLFHLIDIAENHKLWKPIKLSKKGPPLSYLAFADDLILFSEATLDQAEIINTCMDLFCKSSGMKVSQEKTSLFLKKCGVESQE
uniref:Transposon TX1 uncharacterized n=1 Tax=Cajanus cajan TaxID=3821 RepID=A0A151R869_CAJCA|nr:Transposon TX1 uncharacterized [Cajanus cajan]